MFGLLDLYLHNTQMELNQILNNGSWGETSARLNENFAKVGTEIEKVKLSTSRNKGLFPTEEALKIAVPYPIAGDWAVLGDTLPGPIYRCDTAGVWEATGEIGGGANGKDGDPGPQGPQGDPGIQGPPGDPMTWENMTDGEKENLKYAVVEEVLKVTYRQAVLTESEYNSLLEKADDTVYFLYEEE